jgi:hypothetical protein
MQLENYLKNSHEKIIWLDISVDEILAMDELNSRNQLVSQQEDSL